jgi:micrococcal nuclease
MTDKVAGLVGVATILLLTGALGLAQDSPLRSTPSPVALVERVVDGDTVVVRLDGQAVKVRLIGVDAPESVDPRKPVQRFGHESADFLRRLVEGKRVRLAYEPAGARVDKYGRTLAYLYRVDDGLFVNREIIARGYGHAYTKYPFAYMEDFRAAERQAREKGRQEEWLNPGNPLLWQPFWFYIGRTASGHMDQISGHRASASGRVPGRPPGRSGPRGTVRTSPRHKRARTRRRLR